MQWVFAMGNGRPARHGCMVYGGVRREGPMDGRSRMEI